jgi:hypothetical protein
MEEPNNCPKPDCARSESTHRYSAGKRLSICGNGHHWDQAEIAAQRAKARDADTRELAFKPSGGLRIGIDAERLRREFEDRFKGHFS